MNKDTTVGTLINSCFDPDLVTKLQEAFNIIDYNFTFYVESPEHIRTLYFKDVDDFEINDNDYDYFYKNNATTLSASDILLGNRVAWYNDTKDECCCSDTMTEIEPYQILKLVAYLLIK